MGALALAAKHGPDDSDISLRLIPSEGVPANGELGIDGTVYPMIREERGSEETVLLAGQARELGPTSY